MILSGIYNNLILAACVAVAAGLVGSFALMRKMTLASDAMSHIALPGLGLALLFKINPIIGGGTALILGAILIWALEKKTQISTETVVGVVFSASLAVGTLITPSADLIDALFGGFGGLSWWGLVLGILVAVLITIFILSFKKKLILSMISPELATANGLNVNRLNLYFLIFFALTIILGLKFLGALLMGSLIIIPAAAAKNLAKNLGAMLAISSSLGVLSVIAGFIFANHYHLTVGPVIVSAAAIIFFISIFLSPLRDR